LTGPSLLSRGTRHCSEGQKEEFESLGHPADSLAGKWIVDVTRFADHNVDPLSGCSLFFRS
jgi:hypothetical protein